MADVEEFCDDIIMLKRGKPYFKEILIRLKKIMELKVL